MRQGNINLGFLYANSRKEFGIPNFKRISPPQSMSLPILSLYFPTNAVPDTSASAPRHGRSCSQIRTQLGADTNASGSWHECAWELIRAHLGAETNAHRPAFAIRHRGRNGGQLATWGGRRLENFALPRRGSANLICQDNT